MSKASDGLIGALRGLALSYLKKQVMGYLVRAIPWLFVRGLSWLTNPLIGFLVDKILIFLVDETIMGLSLAWISVDVQYEVLNAEQAAKRLIEILENSEKYTEAQIKETEAQFDEAMVKLIRIELVKVT